MQIAEVVLVIFIFCGVLGIIGLIYYNRFEELKVYINEAELNVDECLRKKFDTLNRLVNVINGNIDNINEKFDEFTKLKGKKMANYEMDRKLVDCSNLFYGIADKHTELKKVANYTKLIKELEKNEEKLIASKDYYNTFISKFNRLVRMFPSNIIAMFQKHTEKTFFDGKNMYDEVYNDFQV